MGFEGLQPLQLPLELGEVGEEITLDNLTEGINESVFIHNAPTLLA